MYNFRYKITDVLTFEAVDEILSVNLQTKATELYFPVLQSGTIS